MSDVLKLPPLMASQGGVVYNGQHIDYWRERALRTETVPSDKVTIPRAQYEALMAAGQFMLSRATNLVPCGCKICDLAAALRAAGIQREE